MEVSVEYLVTGKNCSLPKSIKPEVCKLSKEINHLSENDLELLKKIVERLKSK